MAKDKEPPCHSTGSVIERVLVDRQRPVKNVTLDRATVLQFDADGTDGALDAAADCDVLRNDAALDLSSPPPRKLNGRQRARRWVRADARRRGRETAIASDGQAASRLGASTQMLAPAPSRSQLPGWGGRTRTQKCS